MYQVYLSLGTNLGNRKRNIREVIEKIGEQIGVVERQSALYETKPWPRVIGQMMCSIGLPSSEWMNRCGSLCSTSWNRNMLKMGSINLSSLN